MIAGIVLLALGVKNVLSRVDEPLELIPAVALCGGPASHATLHHYFPTKDDLVQAVVDSVIHGDIARPLVEAADPKGPLEQLRRLLLGMLGTSDDDEHSALMLELLRHGRAEAVIEPFSRYTAIWHDYLENLVRRGQAAGEIRDDLDPSAVAGLVIQAPLGMQTRTARPFARHGDRAPPDAARSSPRSRTRRLASLPAGKLRSAQGPTGRVQQRSATTRSHDGTGGGQRSTKQRAPPPSRAGGEVDGAGT